MSIPDPSFARRIKQLEQQLGSLERSLSQVRQSQASFAAPRDRWLGRVATSPTPTADDDTYAVDLLSATFAATPGQQNLVEHARGSTVVARTWPARALSAGDEVIVERIRGGLAGDAERGEWWIGLDPLAPAAMPYAVFDGARLVTSSSSTGDTMSGREADGTIYYESVREFGDAQITTLGNGASATPGGYVCTLDDPDGAYLVALWQGVTIAEGGPVRWVQYTTGGDVRPYGVVAGHVHDFLIYDQTFIRADIDIVADSGPGHGIAGPTNYHIGPLTTQLRGQYLRRNVGAVASIGIRISHETAHGYDEQRPNATTIVGAGQLLIAYLGQSPYPEAA